MYINRLLSLLETRQFQGVSCSYRIGHGCPLASPWLDGGWTSHFVFPTGDPFLEPSIDVFANPPRVLTPIETEIDFWSKLDKKRLGIYKNAWVAYFKEVHKIPGLESESLRKQHTVQMDIAEKFLPPFPLQIYGIRRLFDEVREFVMAGLSRELVQYLPDTSPLERHLEQISS